MKTVAIANQKGGVGKTTTVINLAASVALAGVKTLVIDLDPQANATSGLGAEKAAIDTSVYAVLTGQKRLGEVVVPTQIENLSLAPSGIDLVGSEIELATLENRERRLKDALAELGDAYPFVFLDCPPSLGMITLNALVASNAFLIPIQCEYYALEGLTQLVRTIDFVKDRFNADLNLEGILCTMYDGRSNLTRQVREEVEKHFGEKMYRTWIPRNVRLAEAPGFGKPGVTYDSQSVGARAYKLLADEFLHNNGIRIYRLETPVDQADPQAPAEAQPVEAENPVGVN